MLQQSLRSYAPRICRKLHYFHKRHSLLSVHRCLNQYAPFSTCISRRLRSNNETRQTKIPVGVIGAGRIATQVHINNILHNRRLDLRWIVENDGQRASEAKQLLMLDDGVPFLEPTCLNEVLSDRSLEAIFILTSTAAHAELIDTCLKKGKAVFVEKPTASNPSDIKSCYELAEKMGKPLLTAFKRRFDAAYQNVYTAYKNGSIGDLQIIRANSRDSPRPSYEFLQAADPAGCSMISDMSIHDIDIITWMTDCQPPESVYAVTHANDIHLQKIGEDDTLGMIIKYKSGFMALLDSNRDARYGYDIKFELFGTEGMASVDNPREASSVIDKEMGSGISRLHYSFPERFEKAFVAELQHFVECLDGTTTPLIKKAECLLTADIIEKGIKSAKEKRVVFFDE